MTITPTASASTTERSETILYLRLLLFIIGAAIAVTTLAYGVRRFGVRPDGSMYLPRWLIAAITIGIVLMLGSVAGIG